MNNLRLLTGVLVALLSGNGVCAVCQTKKVMSIEELFEIAESNSVQLHPHFTAEEVARQEINIARFDRLPEIETSLSLSYIGDGFTTNRSFRDIRKASIPHFGNGFSLKVEQPVYTGGALTASIKMAEQKLEAARISTDIKRDNVRFLLAGYYFDLYKYGNLRKVLEQNIVQAQRVLDDMKVRFEQGMALKNDITRYELLLSNLKLKLIKINNTADILNRNLVVTAGIKDDVEIVPDTTILDRSLPLSGEGWWQNEGLIHAPALRLAETDIEICKNAEKLARSEKLPKIGLEAGWSIDGPILTEVPPINRNLSYWYVGFGVSYNLSSLYKSNRKVAKTQIVTRKSIEEKDALAENIRLGINAAYVSYLEAYEELRTQEKSVELAQINYNTTEMRYSADMALITDMLDAANSKLDAEQQLVNARINIMYSYYKLLFTSGKI